MLIFYILFFIFGTIIGSFLNVVIARLKTKESILKDRSHCPFCKKKLSWYELVPIASFLIQKGRCKKCKKKISWQYPLVELTTGLIFLLAIFNFSPYGGPAVGWQFPGIINILFLLIISSFLIIIFVYDLKHYLVPDEIIYPAIVLTFIYFLFRIWNFGNWNLFVIWNLLFGALLGGAFFLIIVLVSRGRWMGMGDVKIGVLMGLLLGLPQVFVAIFLAFLIGAFISIILLLLKKKKLKSEIPFAPFLVGATFVVFLWGDILIKWYLNLF